LFTRGNLSSWVFFKPEEFELGQVSQPADLVQLRDLVFPDVQFLKKVKRIKNWISKLNAFVSKSNHLSNFITKMINQTENEFYIRIIC
jgi:hypothetical protein